MPTPTIDPAAYEAAYQAVKQFTINREVYGLIGLGIVVFLIWLFGGGE